MRQKEKKTPLKFIYSKYNIREEYKKIQPYINLICAISCYQKL